MKKLLEIQAELKCPKGSLNKFGNYKYRSAEQILESVKPLLQKHGATLTLSDDIIQVGNKLFLKAKATLKSESDIIEISGFAELGEHKGMSSEQCTGTASSYARKYALNGLFLIDETESDPDSKDNTKTEVKKFTERLEEEKSKQKPAIDNARFEKAIESIRNSEFSVEQLQAKFELTELQSKALLLINQ
jgi:hypothetical protein